MTFEAFKARVDKTIAKVAGGLTSDDLADACWHDLYVDTGGEASEQEILETMQEADDSFRFFMEASR